MFVCFDLETTGLSVDKGAEVVEFSYILFDSRNMFVRAEQLFFYHKGMNWSEEAYKVHQIPLEFLKTQEDKFRGNLVKMYAVLNYANVIGHNNKSFDCPFATKWLMRMGLPELHFNQIQDTMIDFRPITKRARIKLTKLAAMRNLPPEGVANMEDLWFGETAMPNCPHSGAYDVTATALLALDGIRNGLISFDQSAETQKKPSALPTSEDVAALLESGTKVVDPNKLMVIYVEDGESHYVYVNHDRAKYAVMEPTFNEVEQCYNEKTMIPVKLTPVDDNIYEYKAEHFTIRYELCLDPGDKLTIITPYGEFKDTEMNMQAFIENNFKGVDYV